MVFGIFSRKPAVTVEPTPISEPNKEQLHTSPLLHDLPVQRQLRTPSPSIASGSTDNSNLSPSLSSIHPRSNLASPNGLPVTPSPPLTEDPAALQALLMTIPPRILHDYTLARLQETMEPPSPLTLTVLTSFFSALTPPPLLHCVRCHKGFFDVENNDRSCTVPHEDDTALIERVGKRNGRLAGEYETLWGCCGRTVEGDGDQGPPDGWCYEGRHTTDSKRARFRADSTIYDDKLTSCAKLRCHGPPPSSSSHPNMRKRPRARMLEDSSSEDDNDESKVVSAVDEIVAKKRKRSGSMAASVKSKKSITSIKGKGKAKVADTDLDLGEDTEMSVSGAESTRKPKSKTTKKPRSGAAPMTPKKSVSIPIVEVPIRAAAPKLKAKKGALAKTLTAEVLDSEEENSKKMT